MVFTPLEVNEYVVNKYKSKLVTGLFAFIQLHKNAVNPYVY